MVKEKDNLYVCEGCEFLYKEKHSCSLKITRHSVKGGD